MKKKLWFILFILGLSPFVILLIGGIYASMIGFSPIWMSTIHYGWDAFRNHVILWSYLYWPSYIVGMILIIVSMIVKKGK